MNVAFLRYFAVAAFAAWGASASAVDISTSAPPLAMADLQLAVTTRSLMLPPGNWSYVAHTEGFIRNWGVDRKAPHHTAYAIDVSKGRMKSAVVLRMPVNSTPVNFWNEEPCKVEGYIHKDDFGGNVKMPECLVVFKRKSHLAVRPDNAFYAQAYDWAVSQSIKMPGPVYEVIFSRFASNDFGVVRVFVPLGAVANDDEMIAWARQLPPLMKPLFENRESVATLPALPSRAKN